MSRDETSNLMLVLGKMDGKLDATHERLDAYLKKMDSMDERLGVLEHFRTGLMSKISLVTIIIGGMWTYFIKRS